MVYFEIRSQFISLVLLLRSCQCCYSPTATKDQGCPLVGYPADLDQVPYQGALAILRIVIWISSVTLVILDFGLAGAFLGCVGDLMFYSSRATTFYFLGALVFLSDNGGGLCPFGARSSTLAVLRSNATARATRIYPFCLEFRES